MRKFYRVAVGVALAGLVAANIAMYQQVQSLESRVRACEDSQTMVIDSLRKSIDFSRMREEVWRARNGQQE